jgi:hypothetical protein
MGDVDISIDSVVSSPRVLNDDTFFVITNSKHCVVDLIAAVREDLLD